MEKKEFCAEAPLSNPYFTPCHKTYDFLCFDIILVSVFLIVFPIFENKGFSWTQI